MLKTRITCIDSPLKCSLLRKVPIPTRLSEATSITCTLLVLTYKLNPIQRSCPVSVRVVWYVLPAHKTPQTTLRKRNSSRTMLCGVPRPGRDVETVAMRRLLSQVARDPQQWLPVTSQVIPASKQHPNAIKYTFQEDRFDLVTVTD